MNEHGVPTVVVAGGGIGGLSLAHGLRAADIPVRVLERTRARTDWLQGYRIHIDPRGATALHRCLSTRAWDAFLAAVSDQDTGFAFRTETLAPLLVISDATGTDPHPARRHHGISRISLREALLTDLDDTVETGRAVTGWSPTDGGVVVHVDDGDDVPADLLVGADGADSVVRAQLLPTAHRIDTGTTAVAGKHRLTSDTALPDELVGGPVSVLPAHRGFLFTAVWRGDRAHPAAALPGAPPGFLLDTTADYVFWAYADASSTFPDRDVLGTMSGADLRALVGDAITGWSPDLRRLVAGSEPDTIRPVWMRSASRPTGWTSGPVTLLGDAIHNMTPAAGIGANTALRDAALLSSLITGVRGRAGLLRAVSEYERQMLDYGFRAVAASHRNAVLAGSHSRVRRAAFRAALRVVDRVPSITRRMMA